MSTQMLPLTSAHFRQCFRENKVTTEFTDNLAQSLNDSRCVNSITFSYFCEIIFKVWDNNVENTSATAISTDSQIADKDSVDDSEQTTFSASIAITISMLEEAVDIVVFWSRGNCKVCYIGEIGKRLVKSLCHILKELTDMAKFIEYRLNAVIWQLCSQTRF